MCNTKHVFDYQSNTGTAGTRAQVVALPNVGSIRTPYKDINQEYIAAAAALGRAGAGGGAGGAAGPGRCGWG